MILQIDNLCKQYAIGVIAMSNVLLIIQKGMFGMLGPNGAGKSSLITWPCLKDLPTVRNTDDALMQIRGKV